MVGADYLNSEGQVEGKTTDPLWRIAQTVTILPTST